MPALNTGPIRGQGALRITIVLGEHHRLNGKRTLRDGNSIYHRSYEHSRNFLEASQLLGLLLSPVFPRGTDDCGEPIRCKNCTSEEEREVKTCPRWSRNHPASRKSSQGLESGGRAATVSRGTRLPLSRRCLPSTSCRAALPPTWSASQTYVRFAPARKSDTNRRVAVVGAGTGAVVGAEDAPAGRSEGRRRKYSLRRGPRSTTGTLPNHGQVPASGAPPP